MEKCEFNSLKSSIMHIIELNADICSYNRYNKIVVKNVFVENGVLRYVNTLTYFSRSKFRGCDFADFADLIF